MQLKTPKKLVNGPSIRISLCQTLHEYVTMMLLANPNPIKVLRA